MHSYIKQRGSHAFVSFIVVFRVVYIVDLIDNDVVKRNRAQNFLFLVDDVSNIN